jgi:MtrB/PioB family decaheme-associated outer membrane protein
MRRNITGLLAVAIMAWPTASLAEWEVDGDYEIRHMQVNESDQMSKFNEYRDITDGADSAVNLRADRDDTYYIDLKGDHMGRRTQEMSLKAGRYGEYGVGVSYEQSKHDFFYNAKTPFADQGNGVYTVDDSIQAAIQAANGSTPGAVDTAITQMANAGHPLDLGLDRKTTAANLFYNVTPNIRVAFDVSSEKREGNRPWSNYYSFGFIRESEEPIDYTSTIMNGRIGYQDEDYNLSFNYRSSSFKNAIDTAYYDNPWRLSTDAVGGNLSPAAEYDLVPDNEAMEYSLTGAANLPWNGRLTALWSVGHHKQNDPFVLAGRANPLVTQAALSRGSLDGSADTQNRDLRISLAPIEALTVNLRYNYHHYENKTAMVDYYKYATADRSVSSAYRRNLPLSFEYTTWAADLGMNVADGFKVGAGYEQVTNDRVHREIDNSKDTNYTLSAQYRPNGDLGWVFLKGAYKMNQRRGDHYVDVTEEEGYSTDGVTPGNGSVAQLPMLQKFDIGDRDRNEINLLAQISPERNFDIAASFISSVETYKVMDRHIPSATDSVPWAQSSTAVGLDQLYGMTDNKMTSYGLDVSWMVDDTVRLNAFYSYDKYSYTQSTRNSAGFITPDFTTDWTLNGEDTVTTVGLGAMADIGKTSLSLDYSYTDGKSSYAFSGPDVEGDDLSNLTDVTNKLTSMNAKADYHFSDAFTLGLSYLYEKYDVVDWALDNVALYNPSANPTGATVNGNLLLGVGNNSYDVSVVSLVAKYTF